MLSLAYTCGLESVCHSRLDINAPSCCINRLHSSLDQRYTLLRFIDANTIYVAIESSFRKGTAGN